jgi:hypothetical protein
MTSTDPRLDRAPANRQISEVLHLKNIGIRSPWQWPAEVRLDHLADDDMVVAVLDDALLVEGGNLRIITSTADPQPFVALSA